MLFRSKAAAGSREWLPFVVRLYFYAGSDNVRLVHTIVYNGDEQKDFIRGLGVEFELLVVNDGSSDGTAELAERLAMEHDRVRVIHHPINRGLGGGYRTGFDTARGDWLIFFPADGQFPARATLPRFWQSRHGVDLVLGQVAGRTDSMAGRVLSLAERVLYRALFGGFPR